MYQPLVTATSFGGVRKTDVTPSDVYESHARSRMTQLREVNGFVCPVRCADPALPQYFYVRDNNARIIQLPKGAVVVNTSYGSTPKNTIPIGADPPTFTAGCWPLPVKRVAAGNALM